MRWVQYSLSDTSSRLELWPEVPLKKLKFPGKEEFGQTTAITGKVKLFHVYNLTPGKIPS